MSYAPLSQLIITVVSYVLIFVACLVVDKAGNSVASQRLINFSRAVLTVAFCFSVLALIIQMLFIEQSDPESTQDLFLLFSVGISQMVMLALFVYLLDLPPKE